MEWSALYGADKQPSEQDISSFIGNPLWGKMNTFLSEGYETAPAYSYSTCSGQPGWNVKYKKAGRSLCTLYPMEGYFIALVVIGAREQMEAELVVSSCAEYTQNLYTSVPFMMGGKWLMINVTDEKILEDTQNLIQTRRKIKKAA